MHVLLTGATGFLGNNILRALLAAGHQVTATVRHTSDLRPFDGLECEKVTCDLAQPSDIGSIVSSADLLIHSAAMIQIGWSKKEASQKVNVQATKVLAEAARRHDTRMIHVSSVDALAVGTTDRPATEEDVSPAKSQCSYVVSKRAAEEVFLDSVAAGLDGVIVNPGFMVGPWDWKPSSGEMMMAIAKGPVPFAPAGGCSVVDVRDVADGIMYAISRGKSGERYILGGNNMSYLELWQMMAGVIGKNGPTRKLPNFLAGIAGRFGDLASKFLKNETQVNSAATAMGQMLHWYDSGKAIGELSYSIGSVEDALNDAWDWFKRYEYV